MEIAEQWQREWTGTAEYGKVTEGGVTRNVARAMEVLHASKPGARVRVMRAAYHSTAGPGLPASSYMLHSSRRVISSGFNYTDPPSLPSLPTKPLEISSTPLDSSLENAETENYKVTEPDDLDISEPSKWRGSTSKSTIRMPSEESSSTDNASIIDVDSRTDKHLNRKYSYDSESSDIQWNKSKTRASPILHAPVALNTLKYKSLLNSSNEWHNRRKSYSFEDTVPSKESMLCGNNTIAIESSTDSGICKSSEIVNEPSDDTYSSQQEQKNDESNEETFTDWLSKNRRNSFYSSTKFKTYKEHEILIEEPNQNNITLQSPGKMSISLPINVKSDNSHQHKKSQIKDDGQRKIKKVEFCKTELHFAAETGKVNIIATDEKPPPSNDFRKRRSMFLPLHDMPEKPITLFGDKVNEFPDHSYIEISDNDENTAATKSILKNKIPKPKPYLLGENMEFGSPSNLNNENRLTDRIPVLTAVSLINKQLQLQRRYSDEITSDLTKDIDSRIHKSNDIWTDEKGPTKDVNINTSEFIFTKESHRSVKDINDIAHMKSIKNKFHDTKMSPIQQRSKTRELRVTDLPYFGVDTDGKEKDSDMNIAEYTLSSNDSDVDNLFQSVKLIQKIANSVCSSETELDDMPEYQNIPICIDNAPVPTPKMRTKYDDKRREVRILKPIVEQESHKSINGDQIVTRRSRFRRQEENMMASNRSVSEPPKRYRYNSLEKTNGQQNQTSRCVKNHRIEENVKHKTVDKTKITNRNKKSIPIETTPIYVNLNIENENVHRKESSPRRPQPRDLQSKVSEKRDLKCLSKNLQPDKLVKAKIRHNDSETNTLKKNQRSLDRPPMEKVEVNIKTKNHENKINNSAPGSQNSNKSIRNQHTIENKTANEKELQHKGGTPHNHSVYIRSEKISNNVAKVKNERKISTVNNNDNADTNRRSYKENVNTVGKEQSLPSAERNKKICVHNVNSTQITMNDNNIKNKEFKSKSHNHKTSRKNEYVINYDDKNGTVSSVCKIKQGPAGTSRKKNISKEFLDENAKEHPLKYKPLNKIDLLQFTDQPRPRNGLSYADRKRKTKMEERKSCQLL